ncbi:hypothetical protein HD806DRAFT_525763 [Xylariaceae sp. AK1471]|nr:hypothetical protein HD806DRAFT_525763 [Xylariaceae sp. AK1471]
MRGASLVLAVHAGVMLSVTLLYSDFPGSVSDDSKTLATQFQTLKPCDRKSKNRDDWDSTPAHRVAVKKYHKEGVVCRLETAGLRDGFVTQKILVKYIYLCSIFFPLGLDGPMMKVTSDPLRGWAIDEVTRASNGGAQHDVYDKLFYHAREQLRLFIGRLRAPKADIEVHCRDARDLSCSPSGRQVRSDRDGFLALGFDMGDEVVGGITPTIRHVLDRLLRDKTANLHAKVIDGKRS